MHQLDRRLVVISGPLCAGKTTLAMNLGATLPAEVLSARQVLMEYIPVDKPTRQDLQKLGARIERATGGAWLSQAAIQRDAKTLIVDSARTVNQLRALKRATANVSLILLEASEAERKRRFKLRQDPIDESEDIKEAFAREPRFCDEFRCMAELMLDTDRLSVAQAQKEAVNFLEHA